MGYWVGYRGVGVRVEVCPPCKNPHPSLGYPGYWTLAGTSQYQCQHALDRSTLTRSILSCAQAAQSLLVPSSHPHIEDFNMFGPILQPNVCILLDIGTMAGPSSIYHLWKAFNINLNVRGACREIVALKGKYREKLLNPLGLSE